MNATRFDQLTRIVSHALSRRRLAIAFGVVASGASGLAEAKKRKRKKKLKKNQFGCVKVGGKCRGKSANCCSGICQGKKPKKGKQDKSRCMAHNVLDCPVAADSCGQTVLCGTNGACWQTTGQASFCSAGGNCRACKKDVDCEPEFGPGAACVVCAPCLEDTRCAAAAV